MSDHDPHQPGDGPTDSADTADAAADTGGAAGGTGSGPDAPRPAPTGGAAGSATGRDAAPAVLTPALSDPHRSSAEAVTWPVRVAASWSWRLLIIALGVYAALRVLSLVSLVAFSLVVAIFLTAVLHPLQARLRRVLPRLPKSIPALFALLVGLAVVALIAWFVTWQISTNSGELANSISSFVAKTKEWLKTGPLHLKETDFNKLAQNINKVLQDHQGQLVSGAVATLRTVSEIAASALLVVLATFFFLRDGSHIWRWVLSLTPRPAQERIDYAGRVGWRTMGGYVRGVVLIALFHGVTITILLEVLRVPLAPALGVLIFLGSFIPLIGLTVTGALAVAVALLEHGVTSAIVVAVAIIVLVQVEGHLLQPMIMSRTVEIHPLAVAVAVLSGTALAGIGGALIAVPLVALLNSTIRALRAGPGRELATEDMLRVQHAEHLHDLIHPPEDTEDGAGDG